MLGGTSLAPTGKPPVPGQFDDAAPATSVTTYDKFGRPNLSGIGRSDGGGEGGGGGGNAESAASGREKEGRGSTSGDKGREWDRNRCAWIARTCVFFIVVFFCECVRACGRVASVCYVSFARFDEGGGADLGKR